MKTRLVQSLLETIREHHMLRPGDRAGVGVSGGADSVALLRLLDELRGELGIRLLVLHFNHQLRGQSSDADEEFVRSLAADRGLEFVSAREDVAREARQNGWNLEDAARRLRYGFFASLVASGRATRIAVAHTADDQAETVMAHLLRGTGPAGLAAIYPMVGHVVRPLLGIRRQQLRHYLAGLEQIWREDETNLDTKRLRARIRHRLMPQLEKEFQGHFVGHLNRLAGLAREDEAFWSALLTDRYRALVERTPSGCSIGVSDLLVPFRLGPDLSRSEDASGVLAALTKRLVRRIFEELKGDRRQLTAWHVGQVIHLARSCLSGQRVKLPGGVVVERSFDRLVFSVARPADSPGQERVAPYEYVVELGGRPSTTISIPELGRRFQLKLIDWPPVGSDTNKQVQAVDADRLRAPLVLRNWRPGDSYRPHGRRHVRKLKRLLLENRVALRERAGWPVLTSAGLLVWARGLPVADGFAPQPGTKAGLLIAEETW